MDLKAVKIPDSKKKGSDKKGKKKFDGKKDANEPSNKKEIQEVREGKGFGEGPGTKGWGKNENTKKLSLSDRWKAKRLKKRLAKAEKDGGVSTDTDYSQIDNEPKTKRVKAESYKTPSASSAEAKENKERMDKSQEVSLNKAAKKHNVKPGDLEAKEINGKKEYFPKQGVQGGFDRNFIPVIDEQTGDPKLDQDGEVVMRIDPEDKGTKWDDKLGRFKKAKATTGTMEEQQKAVEEMKPKYPQGMDPSLEAKGEIALNYETNTYEYTNAYNSRIAREKIAATEAERANQNAVTSEPVVEKTTTTPDRKPKPSDFEGSFKEKQAQYKIANEEWYQAQQAKKGKSPMEMRDNRIYRNARADGPVRRNMIKGGYTPPN